MSEENSPGKIYSTLKRPQVETKVGVAYTYRYLDFLIGKDENRKLEWCAATERVLLQRSSGAIVGFDQQPAHLPQLVSQAASPGSRLRAVGGGGGVERTKRTLGAS
ncbi:hypothetical protein KUCAC02_013704 [Chaenocephalus aceratus]|uniref:Uncharacterized protein n=1 Tax=Chaenocephalus aceratus TaxID=36190 RepID=A0ACB9WBU4_CHAAC|nr:hypothetical protein KUCAC02_013704 [Chaenocephalus aceratus]